MQAGSVIQVWILLLQTQATSATAQRPAPRTVAHTRLPNSQTPADRWRPPPPLGPKSHFNVAGIEVEIMPDTGRHQAEPRQKTEKRPQYHRHEGRSNSTSQGVQLTADRPWEDTTPWAHSHSTHAPQPGGTLQQCNRASAKPGQGQPRTEGQHETHTRTIRRSPTDCHRTRRPSSKQTRPHSEIKTTEPDEGGHRRHHTNTPSSTS